MALTAKQTSRYWREIAEVCRVQGWGNAEKEARRRAIHKAAGCPASMREFTNRHFDAFLQECAALRNRIDIRDRERERVEVAVERLNAALRAITGKDFARGIVADMHDAERPLNLPLDPRKDQQKRGIEHPAPDLENLRDTLKNRLSTLLSQLKGTQRDPKLTKRGKFRRRPNAEAVRDGALTCPPQLTWALAVANNPAIAAIIAGKVAVPMFGGGYAQVTRAEYEALQRRRTAGAPPVPAVEISEDADVAPLAQAAAAEHEPEDDTVPF